jgi:hypothetical protein
VTGHPGPHKEKAGLQGGLGFRFSTGSKTCRTPSWRFRPRS